MSRDEMVALLFKINCVYPSQTRLSEVEHAIRVDEWMSSAVGALDYGDALDAWDRWKDHEGWAPSPADLAAAAKALARRAEYAELEAGDDEGPELAGDEVRSRARALREAIARSGT